MKRKSFFTVPTRAEKSFTPSTSFVDWGGISTPNHQILTLLNECNAGDAFPVDPRTRLDAFRAINYSIPMCNRAHESHVFIMGRPEVVAADGDEGLNRLLEDFQGEFWVKQEIETRLKNKATFQDFLQKVFHQAIIDGSGFVNYEPLEDDGLMNAARVFDAQNYTYVYLSDMYELQYSQPMIGTRIITERAEGFEIFRPMWSPRWRWGLPLLSGAEFTSHAILRQIISQIDTRTMNSAQPSITLITAPAEEFHTTEQRDNVVTLGNKIKTKHENAVKHAHATGKRSDILATVPNDLKLVNHTVGDKITAMPGWQEEYNAYGVQLCHATRTSPSLMGFSTGSDGLGSQKFRIEMDQQKAFVKPLREVMTTLALSGAKMHLASLDRKNARWFDNLTVEYAEPTTTDLKEFAEISKLEAEAEAQRMENFSLMPQILPLNPATEAQRQYAERIDREEWING